MGRIAQSELMPSFSGYTVNGRLRLLESLGSGAYGKVYRAIDCISFRPKFYAVKCLQRPEPGSRTDLLQQREFSLHKLVSAHPNIVTFHQFFRDTRFVYVVLDLVAGGDLFGAITERHLFLDNVQLIKTAFIQLIDAVQYCHDLGVFHRDIKPENVLCSADGADIRLADFGLSIQSPVCRDFGCGSSYYMSPECIGREFNTGKYSTRHNDIWALGVILTNMITGRNPWRYATTEDDCFSAYLHDNDFLRRVLPISGGVNALLKKIFTINPLRRISLSRLRYEIVDLDTFFDHLPSHSLLEDGHNKGSSARARNMPHHQSRPPSSSSGTAVSLKLSTKSPESSDERYIFSSPVVDHPPVKTNVSVQLSNLLPSDAMANFDIGGSANSLSVPLSGHSGSSGPESKGPITPDTHPIELAVEVPDIPAEEGLGQPAEFHSNTFISKFNLTSAKSRKPKALFRSAVQRLKLLPAASSST